LRRKQNPSQKLRKIC